VDPRGFLDGLLKTKMIIPSPSKYDLSRPIMEKSLNPIVVKSPRITEAAQIEIFSKKHKRPGPQDHKVKLTTQQPRVLMGKSDKGAMSGYLDNAIYLAQTSPGFKSINHYHVEKLPVR
jgi:hypothetical protein